MLKANYPRVTNRISKKIGKLFSKIPVSPTMWTFLSLLAGFLCFLSLLYKDMVLGLIFFIISGFLDAVDGAVARVMRKVSNKGGYLDGIIDRMNEGFLLFGLMLFGLPDFIFLNLKTPAYLWISLLLFFGSVLVSYSRAYAAEKKVIVYEETLKRIPGILERPERLILVFIGMILYFIKPVYLTYTIVLAFFLSLITFLQRIVFVMRFSK